MNNSFKNLLIGIFLVGLRFNATAATTPPNIIFTLADDYGVGEVSAYGADNYKTPHIDQLARGGIRFTHAYTPSLCGPSRATILTGRYLFRTGATNQDATGQQVLLPENSLIQNNRFIRLHAGPAVSITVADSAPPLARFRFQPNRYEGNIISGKKPLLDPVRAGFSHEEIPADWSEATARTGYQPLTPTDVGPAWVIAARQAGRFNTEDDAPQPRAAALPQTAQRKK